LSLSDGIPDHESPAARLPAATAASGDPNVLRHYAGVLRRRYYWIVLGLVVGLIGGFVSTLFVHVTHDPNHYYKATNTLLASNPTSSGSDGQSSGVSANLQQAAFLVRSAQVTDAVAKKLGVSNDVVNNQLTATARSDVSAVDVTAISTNPQQAVQMANIAATALNTYVLAEEQSQFHQETKSVEDQLTALQDKQTSLEAQLTEKGANTDIINAQLDSVVNQYRLTYEQFQSMASAGAPTAPMSTLQSATPVQISGKAYQYRLSQNENDAGQISGSQSVAPTFDETDLSTAPPVSKGLRLLIGATAGLVMGVATAFLVEAWDDRIRRRDRVEAVTGFPVIAEIPKLARQQVRDHSIPAVDAGGTRAAERYRAARTAILFGLEQVVGKSVDRGVGPVAGQAPVVMVTSPNPGEGKTTTVASLAAVFGDNGLRTLVIDCDFRKPAVARYLAPVLNLVDPGSPVPTRLEGVSFLGAPRAVDSPADAVTRLRQAVVQYREQFDIVLLDTPPMLTTNDASDLLGAADAVVVVLRSGQTRTGPAQRVSVVLNRFRAEVLGVIFNGCEDGEMESYYGYGDAYTYPYGDPGRPSAPARPAGPVPPTPRQSTDLVAEPSPPDPNLPRRSVDPVTESPGGPPAPTGSI
jgi:Mrp family chromosome partitioning ATPase/capsular polysaccharide biosynthesis protein